MNIIEIFGSNRSSINVNVCSFVHSFVCSTKVCLEHTIFIFWPKILQSGPWMTSGWLQDASELSDSTQKALREHLKSTQIAREQSDFVIPSEPKILRLVSRTINNYASWRGSEAGIADHCLSPGLGWAWHDLSWAPASSGWSAQARQSTLATLLTVASHLTHSRDSQE